MPVHRGQCHCGRVRFEVEAPAVLEALQCNCSICSMSGYVQHVVPASKLRVLDGREALSTYSFNTHRAQHLFCKHCGIKAFYVPRSNPDGYAVNVHCLDRTHIQAIRVTPFDGQNWEKHAPALAHLSREGA